jgi:hypothetical protein
VTADPLHEALLDLEVALGIARSKVADISGPVNEGARRDLTGALTVMSDALIEAFLAYRKLRELH